MDANRNKKLTEHNYTVIFLMRSIKALLTTAKMSEAGFTTFRLNQGNQHEWYIISTLGTSLIRILKCGYLLHISNALDCFYEIWSEDFYNAILQEHNLLPMMRNGFSFLQHMFKENTQQKIFAPNELEEIDEALENVMPFVEYKE